MASGCMESNYDAVRAGTIARSEPVRTRKPR